MAGRDPRLAKPNLYAFRDVDNIPPADPNSGYNPIDREEAIKGRNPLRDIYDTARLNFKAVVGPQGKIGVDFHDIDVAISKVSARGGGSILLKNGHHKPRTVITAESNIRLVGEDPDLTIIDFSDTPLTANQAGLFLGGFFVTDTGTIAGTNGSSVITGTSTTFVADGVKAGDVFYINTHPYIVLTVDSDTQITIDGTWLGPNFSGDLYTILRPKKNFFVENLTMESNGAGSNNSAVLMTYGEKVGLSRVRIKGFSGIGAVFEECFNYTSRDVEAHNNLTGIEAHNENANSQVNNGSFINCLAWGNSSRGINVEGVGITNIIGCRANGNDLGIKVLSNEVLVSDCHAEFNKLDGIRVQAFNSCRVVGNNASSNGDVGITLLGTGGAVTYEAITGNVTNLNGVAGIYVDGAYNSITGNTMFLPEDGIGINLTGNGDSNSITGNVIDGNSETGTTGVVFASGADNNSLVGNVLANLTDEVTDSGTGNKIAHNINVSTHTT